MGAGIVTAIATSLCCITPLLTIIAGTSGLVSSFSWLAPLRPYLITLTVLIISFAWYQKLKPQKNIDCNCEAEQEPKFIESKMFLTIITILTISIMAFPYYSGSFYSKSAENKIVTDQSNVKKVEFTVTGMTCKGCEDHINGEVNKLIGIISVNTSYKNSNTLVKYDPSKITIKQIEKTINNTGYKVSSKKEN